MCCRQPPGLQFTLSTQSGETMPGGSAKVVGQRWAKGGPEGSLMAVALPPRSISSASVTAAGPFNQLLSVGGSTRRRSAKRLKVLPAPAACVAALSVLARAWARQHGGSLLRATRRRTIVNCGATPTSDREPATVLPEEVDDYRVTPVCVQPKPPIQGYGRNAICALVVSDEEEETQDSVFWQPPAGTAAQQAISTLGDAFGVLGVWPAAWVAAEQVIALCTSRRRRASQILEIGCGSGLPSLCALASGCDVVATDLEELPLQLLRAAATSQDLRGHLEIQPMDVLAAAGKSRGAGGIVRQPKSSCPSDTQRFDAIVCSDCLYKLDVAEAIARLLARALLRSPMTRVIVTDADRRGRQTFLDVLAVSLGLGQGNSTVPVFVNTRVPAWAADSARDPFDGTSTQEVGLLRLYS